jgi:chemotaxis protein CheD
MRKETINGRTRVIINPGEYYSTKDTEVITTLLGSCVAACLYDQKLKLIGMNHIMLSNPRYSKDMPIHITEAGRYGIHAMELLINDMMAKGTNRGMLRAKVFGGSTIINRENGGGNFFCVGQVNCKFIREYLEAERIPIDAEDLGGDFGRVIHFSNGDFSVFRRKIGHSRSEKLAERDRVCWQNAIVNQEKAQPQIDLW